MKRARSVSYDTRLLSTPCAMTWWNIQGWRSSFERGRRVLGKDLQPEEVVVIGDTQFDIRCGKFIGAKVLAVATGGARLDELKSHQPDWAVEDLTRVTALEICGQR